MSEDFIWQIHLFVLHASVQKMYYNVESIRKACEACRTIVCADKICNITVFLSAHYWRAWIAAVFSIPGMLHRKKNDLHSRSPFGPFVGFSRPHINSKYETRNKDMRETWESAENFVFFCYPKSIPLIVLVLFQESWLIRSIVSDAK